MGMKSTNKARLDVILVARGLADSREQAKRLVMAGNVLVDGISTPKPGMMLPTDIDLHVREKERFVSRGGLKLQHALDEFEISVTDLTCLDVGASTGGFTDCMLQNGARIVYAVDVGASQMHEKIRHDERVRLVENMNARAMTPDLFPQPPQFAAVDVSFISVLQISAALHSVLASSSSAVVLIKPQFEAGRAAVSRGRGVIRDEAVHREVLKNVLDGLVQQGWEVFAIIPSPVTGGSGNIEFLSHLKKSNETTASAPAHIDIDEVIRSARTRLS